MTGVAHTEQGDYSPWAGNGSRAMVALYALEAAGAVVQNVLMARFLPLEQYGILAALLSLGMFVFVCSDMGTGLSACRLLAAPAEPDGLQRLEALWSARIVMSVCSTTVLGGLSLLLFRQHAAAVLLLLASELFRSIAQFTVSAARGAGEVGTIGAVAALERVGTLAGSMAAVLLGWGLNGVAAAYLTARFLSLLPALHWTRSTGLALRWAGSVGRLRSQLASLAPLAALLMGDKVVFYSMPLLLATLGTVADAGIFQASLKVALLPISVCSALAGAYFPEFVRDAATGRHPVNAVVVYSLGIMAAAPLVTLCMWSPALVLSLLYGESFRLGEECLRILAIFILLNITYQLSVHLLPAYHRERVLLTTTSTAAALCLLTAIIGIPFLGAAAAALAAVVYALTALVPNSAALWGAWQLGPEHRASLAETGLALAACLLMTGVLTLFPMSALAFVGWSCGASAVIVVVLFMRNRYLLWHVLSSGGGGGPDWQRNGITA